MDACEGRIVVTEPGISIVQEGEQGPLSDCGINGF